MSIANAFMMRDLANMAGTADSQLAGRANTNQDVIDEFNFRERHGMSRAEMAERERKRRRDAAEDQILEGYRGPVPGDVVADTRGLGPCRSALARYLAWRSRTAVELTDLESTRARLNDVAAAPDKTAVTISELVRRTARNLLANFTGDDDANRRIELDKQLAAERHRSQAAAEALPEVESQIAAKRMQHELLCSREAEFLHPALIEAADEIGLGKVYMRRVAELREVVALIFGLSRVAGEGYGSGFSQPFAIDLPHAGLRSLADLGDSEFKIHANCGNIDTWRKLAAAMIADPRCEASKHLPRIKS
jgi:hypothetical protein